MATNMIPSFEICAGGGGQALGLERAGFHHVGLLDNDRNACATLRYNRPDWRVHLADLRDFDGLTLRGRVRLLSGGVPCPPFSVAGEQRGAKDERDLLPQVLRLTEDISPDAVMIENVRGLLSPKFASYRARLRVAFERLGYVVFDWHLLRAVDYGVPQLRPRAMLVALRPPCHEFFHWPDEADLRPAPTVGEALIDLMASGGWDMAAEWATMADCIAPTLVGGSKKHGGADLGPTRARAAWAELGVDGRSLADGPPPVGFVGPPRLTLRMVARIQGFPDDWQFVGSKTHAYRQVGNALPPPVAQAVGRRIAYALRETDRSVVREPAATYWSGEMDPTPPSTASRPPIRRVRATPKPSSIVVGCLAPATELDRPRKPNDYRAIGNRPCMAEARSPASVLLWQGRRCEADPTVAGSRPELS